MSELIIERRGKLVAQSFSALKKLVERSEQYRTTVDASGEERDVSGENERDTTREVVDSLLGQVDKARARRAAAECLANELRAIDAQMEDLHVTIQSRVRTLEEQAGPLKRALVDAEGLAAYGVDTHLVQKAKELLHAVEAECEAKLAPLYERVDELLERARKIEALPHVQAYLAEKKEVDMKLEDVKRPPGTDKGSPKPALKASAPETPATDNSGTDHQVGRKAPDALPSLAQSTRGVNHSEGYPSAAEARKAFSIWLRREVKPNLLESDIVLTLGLGRALHLRPTGAAPDEALVAQLVSALGCMELAGAAVIASRRQGRTKATYELTLPSSGERMVGLQWVWDGDPRQTAKADGHTVQGRRGPSEEAPSRPTKPVVVCSLVPAEGALEVTEPGLYWAEALSQAIRGAGYTVSDRHPLLPADGDLYLWGTYVNSPTTVLQLFSPTLRTGLRLESDLARAEPESLLKARTRHLQRQLRSQLSVLFPTL